MSDLSNGITFYPQVVRAMDEVVLVRARYGTTVSLMTAIGGDLGLRLLAHQVDIEAEVPYKSWVLAGPNAVEKLADAVSALGEDNEPLFYSAENGEGVHEFLAGLEWVTFFDPDDR